MKEIRIILVDPETRTVEERTMGVELKQLHALIGCRCVDGFRYGDGFVYLDDEGLYRERDELGRLPMTRFHGAPQSLVGPLVLVGPPDADGDETSCPWTVEQVKSMLDFELVPPPIPETRVFVVER